VLRCAQALARLSLRNEVKNEDVDEALRLVEVSKASLYHDQRAAGDQTVSSRIYDLIRGMRESGAASVGTGGARGELNLGRVRELVLAKGFTSDNFQRTVEEYELLDVSFLFLFFLFLSWGFCCDERGHADFLVILGLAGC
jgi:DNA replication licensing factor MCM7